MGDRDPRTAPNGIGGGESSAAADSVPASWVAEFEARPGAEERAWQRRRWWEWVGMGVGNLVVADVFVTLFSIPLVIDTFLGVDLPIPGLEDLLLIFSIHMAMNLPVAIFLWIVARVLCEANGLGRRGVYAGSR